MKFVAFVALAVCIIATSFAAEPWERSEHGKMLKRILPPGPEPAALPDADSTGAKLLERYCVQCHYLPNPSMHSPQHWPHVVERMVRRMRGEGNIGAEMKELMGEVSAPNDDEVADLIEYLRQNGQRPIDSSRYADLGSPEGRAFASACSQCHVLPDPKSHTAKEWPEVVERMRRNLAWIGVVASNRKLVAEPRLEVEQILTFLKRNSR
jgi:cytochrome c2